MLGVFMWGYYALEEYTKNTEAVGSSNIPAQTFFTLK